MPIGVDAGVVQAIQQADGGTVGRDRASAGAAVDRADRSPAKDVQVAAGSEGQFVVIVLQQDDAFLGNLGAQGVGLCTRFFGDSAVAGDQVERGQVAISPSSHQQSVLAHGRNWTYRLWYRD